MKVLFATKNPAKIKKYSETLKEKGIELITAKDLDIDVYVDENGKNSIENAYIKAKAYYDATGVISIGMDNSLHIDGIPEEKQPGTHVRRINGKELNDEEMIEYYTGLVKQYHGKRLNAKWIYGIVIYDGKKEYEYSWDKGNFYFVDKPSEKRNPGYPLDSISVMSDSNKYFVDLTKEDREKNKQYYKDNDVINFILKSLS